MEILNLIYIKIFVIENISNKALNILNKAEGSEQPADVTPIVDYIKGYGLVVLTAICSLVFLFLAFTLVKIGFRISRASADGDAEGRASAIKDIIWAGFGAAIVLISSVTAGIFANIFLANT